MGRIEAEVAAETIDVAPPPLEEDLYEPPHHYQPPSTNQRSTPPPQPFPPPQDHRPEVHHFPPPHQDYDKPPPQAFPPQYDFPDKPPPQAFPPQYDVPDKPPPQMGQVFTPPPQQQTGHYFPSNFASGNQYMHQQQQSPFQGIPMGVQQNQLPTEPWKTDIFDCMKNPQNAIITLFFPCVTFGQIAEILDSGSTSCGTSGMLYSLIACCIAMPCIMSCTYRSKLRSKFGLVESPAPDWVIHCFCEYCALCQEYRELEERGYDPSIGWLGNVAKQQQQQQFGMTPPMQQRMF